MKEIDCLSFINDFLLQKPKPKEEEEVEIFHEREDEPQDETLRLQLMMRPPTQDVAKVDKEAPTNLDIYYENESNPFFS